MRNVGAVGRRKLRSNRTGLGRIWGRAYQVRQVVWVRVSVNSLVCLVLGSTVVPVLVVLDDSDPTSAELGLAGLVSNSRTKVAMGRRDKGTLAKLPERAIIIRISEDSNTGSNFVLI